MFTHMKKISLFAVITTLGTMMGITANANTPNTWQFAVGIHNVDPKANNGPLSNGTPIEIDNRVIPTFNIEYFLKNNLSIEFLGAIPGKHDIASNGTNIGTAKPIAPVLAMQYYFPHVGAVQPFTSAGINYTTFTDETSVLGNVKLDDNLGVALRIGADLPVTQHGKIRADIRWIDVNADVSLNGVNAGEVEIDPLVYGLAYAWAF